MNRRYLAAVLPVIGILWMLDAGKWIGQVFLTEQYLGVIIGVTVLIGLATLPLKGVLRFFDYALGIAACLSWFWLAWNYEQWLLEVTNRGPEKWVPAVIAIFGAIRPEVSAARRDRKPWT